MAPDPYRTDDGSDPLWRRELNAVVLSTDETHTVWLSDETPELDGIRSQALSPGAHAAVLVDHLDRTGSFPPAARTHQVDSPPDPGLRGLWILADGSSFEIRRPSPCPHGPNPLGECSDGERGDAPVPRHKKLHRAECGCTCSGVLRWEHRETTPIPMEYAALTSQVLFNRTWEYFDEFNRRVTRPREWLVLWVEMFDPQLDFAEMDAMCDAALRTGS